MKYSKDGPFEEPVVRCDSCAKLLLVEELRKTGMCPHCSNTRVRNVRSIQGDDVNLVKAWVEAGKVDPDWFALFEEVVNG